MVNLGSIPNTELITIRFASVRCGSVRFGVLRQVKGLAERFLLGSIPRRLLSFEVG